MKVLGSFEGWFRVGWLSFHVRYGAKSEGYVDVTETIKKKCYRNGLIYIPGTDHERAWLFGDPFVGIVKDLILSFTDQNEDVELRLPERYGGFISLPSSAERKKLVLSSDVSSKSKEIVKALSVFGDNPLKTSEMQSLICEYLQPNAKVLEIGAGFGQNTLIIASLLDHDENLVSLECNPDDVNLLLCNKYANNLKFNLIPSLLSDVPLFRWGSRVYTEDTRPRGSVKASTMMWSDLKNKYPISLDTLVAQCDERFLDLLTEHPEILDGITTAVVKNDYDEHKNKQKVDDLFSLRGLKVIKSVRGGPNYASLPCESNFYEVWSK